MHTKCETCHTRLDWIESPKGPTTGWWAHSMHPTDDHAAKTAVVPAKVA